MMIRESDDVAARPLLAQTAAENKSHVRPGFLRGAV
jgi:hypothetical protein